MCVSFPQLIDVFSHLGVDGLLVEYEDMFPYEGELKLLQATAHPAYRCSLGPKCQTLSNSFLTLLSVCSHEYFYISLIILGDPVIKLKSFLFWTEIMF